MPNSVRAIVQGDFIGSCNETLVNKCQCKRPASWIVLEEDGTDSPFQMCNRCKVLSENGITNMPILGVANTSTVEVKLPFPTPITQEEVAADIAALNGEEKNVVPTTTSNVPSTPDAIPAS